MAKDFIAAPSKATDKIVREAISFEEMTEGLRQAAGINKTHYDPYTGKHWVNPEEPTAEQQQQDTAASAAQTVLALTARNPGDGEFRRMYIGNQEFEIWGANRSVLDAKEKEICDLFS